MISVMVQFSLMYHVYCKNKEQNVFNLNFTTAIIFLGQCWIFLNPFFLQPVFAKRLIEPAICAWNSQFFFSWLRSVVAHVVSFFCSSFFWFWSSFLFFVNCFFISNIIPIFSSFFKMWWWWWCDVENVSMWKNQDLRESCTPFCDWKWY